MINLNRQKASAIKKKATRYAGENRGRLRLALILILAVLLTAHVKSCMKENAGKAPSPRLIKTAKAVEKDVPVFIDSFGTLSPVNSADVVSQITGEIKEVLFDEGQEVQAGDSLFRIDKAPYEADLQQARAQLEGDMVDLKFKEETYKRNLPLVEKDLISKQDFDRIRTEMEAAKARVELDKAKVEEALINLGYCDIKAPIDGVTGKRLVDKGNVVTANTGPVLVNIKTIDRLYVDFTVPDRRLPSVRNAMARSVLKVTITPEGAEAGTYEGSLEAIDNTVNEATGTVALRAVVPNDNRELWPGQFVQVKLVLETLKGAVVVPYEAVQLGKDGEYVFVVSRGKADLRNVKAGQRHDDDIVVKSGVRSGEVVATTGQLGLSPGVPVIDVTDHMDALKKRWK
ncbi:MAG: efflux RND transporter periplasmic adaptor subunit [Candidatus Omnitrophica bacterium]|nr:efflux RND transporter periplasmic adaptor subunit [Candidatus Omnitrophota bacterium]